MLLEENPLFGLYLYPEAKELMEKHQDVFWTAQEIPVDKDINDFKLNMTQQQFNLVSYTLQLFVETEQVVGDIWEVFAELFPHSEIEGACSFIGSMEKSVHAFFYQKINDVLNIEPETIAKNQQQIQALKEKLDVLRMLGDRDRVTANIPMALAAVSFIEQVFLFSNFAMLKSFRANGYNLMPNTVFGVDYVVRDESYHGIFASYLFNKYKEEYGLPENIEKEIDNLAEIIYTHETNVVDYLFGDDIINAISAEDLHNFIKSRVNFVLNELGFKSKYEVDNNPIAEWFFKDKESISMHDFFSTGTTNYKRGWKENNFSALQWLKEYK
jgi:ribonucleoside-diphosphate reductase beta chain